MSVQRSNLPNVDSERYAPPTSMFNSLVGSRLKLDNLHLSEMSVHDPEVVQEESTNQGPPPSIIYSYTCRNGYSAAKDEADARLLPGSDKKEPAPFTFGQVFANISDHIILEDFQPGDLSEAVSPIPQPNQTDPVGNPSVFQGLFGTLLRSGSDPEAVAEPPGGNSIHESLVLPRFQRAALPFHKLGSFLGPKSDNLKPLGGDGIANPVTSPSKSRQTSLSTQHNENKASFKSAADQDSRGHPGSSDAQSRSPLCPSSPTLPTDRHLNKTHNLNLHPIAASPCSNHLSLSTPLPDTTKDATPAPAPSGLREFLVRFFTDAPFTPAHCDFSAAESLILSSIFSRKYECDVPTQ